MTAADPLMLPHVAAMLRTLDAGDDGVLPVLADALEEEGDPRAAGLRLVGDRRSQPNAPGDAPSVTTGWWYWLSPADRRASGLAVLPEAVAWRASTLTPRDTNMPFCRYASRSRAFLALAAALAAP